MPISRPPAHGILLALAGALILTPDALLMRISGMDGLQMLGWRGTSMGLVMILAWRVLAGARWRADLPGLFCRAGAVVILAQAVNGALFSMAIAMAPVTIVLLGVATVPVFAALLSRVLLAEPTDRATWITICAVLAGIALAVLGKSDSAAVLVPAHLLGGLMGLGVAGCLALGLVTLRRSPQVPILPAVGSGALIAGLAGIALTGPAAMPQGEVWAIAVTGLVILPASFFLLGLAARHTAAANVSLLLLLETVVAPVWVWLGTSEAPTPLMLAGGAVVVGSLAVYLLRMRSRDRAG